MKILIANILNSKLAIYHEEGLVVFDALKEAYSKEKPIVLSFVGLSRCSTQFLNASIGKLYLSFDPKIVDSLVTYEYGDYSLMETKVKEVRDNAINSKEYDALIENA